MHRDRSKILADSIRRLLRRGASSHLRKIVRKTHAADLAAVFQTLSPAHQQQLFETIESREQKGGVLSELDRETLLDLVEDLDLDELVR
ncbi:MAG: magnesium transporter, partial [Desulfobacteraceae bacterium]